MRAARRTALSLLAAVTSAGAMLAPTAARAVTAPVSTITSPTSGGTVAGLVTITTTGDFDASDVSAKSSQLVVDGTSYGLPKPCSATAVDQCPTTFVWDASGLAGSHTLAIHLFSAQDPVGANSAAVTVAAVNPAPTVTITSPKPNEAVHGTVTVSATGSVDLSQSDTAAVLQLWVDGAKYGLPVDCTLVAATAKTCTVTFTVAQPTWSGAHTVKVTMLTPTSSAASDVVSYFAYSPSKVTLTRIPWTASGKSAVIRGTVVATTNGGPVVGARVRLTLAPAVGKAHSITVGTGATGHFSLATKVAVNTTVTATVLPAPAYGTSRASVKVGVFAPIACRADKSVRHGRFGSGTCTVAHLPDGTKVSLEYESGKKWHVLGAGTTRGTSIPISFQFGKAGSFPVR